jgi:ketol-acid reductoisomerase
VKILWISNSPTTPTGYGKQTALFAPRLKEQGHDIAIAANAGVTFGPTKWQGITVYPQALGQSHGLDAIR